MKYFNKFLNKIFFLLVLYVRLKIGESMKKILWLIVCAVIMFCQSPSCYAYIEYSASWSSRPDRIAPHSSMHIGISHYNHHHHRPYMRPPIVRPPIYNGCPHHYTGYMRPLPIIPPPPPPLYRPYRPMRPVYRPFYPYY